MEIRSNDDRVIAAGALRAWPVRKLLYEMQDAMYAAPAAGARTIAAERPRALRQLLSSIDILDSQRSIPASEICHEQIGNGPPLLLVHGNPATHTLWQPITADLARHRTLLAVDLPGFGGSPAPGTNAGFARERIARTLLDFMVLRGHERFDLVGHSFGGAVASTMAALRPDRIRSLTLITPMSDRVPPVARLIGITLAREIARVLWKLLPRPLRRMVILRLHRTTTGAAFNERRAAQVMRELEGSGTVDTIVGIMTAFDYPAYTRTLTTLSGHGKIPMLLIGCGRDEMIPYRQFVRVQSLLFPERCRVFEGGGHLPMWQFPREVAGTIIEFIEAEEA